MKKVLFTLALAAFGLIAGAQGKPAPVLAFGTDAENLITEIELAPGEQQEFQVILTEQQEAVVMGFQLQWLMKDANGALTEALTCPAIYPDDPDDPMDYYWTNPENLSTATTAVGGLKGNSLASSNPEFATWRWVATNTGRNQFWYPRNANVPPIAVGTMTIKAGADWTDDFATFELDLEYTLYNQTYETTPSSMAAYEARPEAPMVLTIRNKNAQPPVITVADPVIAFAEENNVLTVTVSCETADAVLTVNGQVVEGNPYSYTVEHTNIYEEQVVNVTAQAAVGDVTSEEVSNTYTFQAQTQPTADEPVITFDEDNSGVMITIENFTEYTVTVDGVLVQSRNEDYCYVAKVYDKAQAIEVYAKNDPGYPYLPADDTKTYNLPAKVKEQNSTPNVSYSYEGNEITVWGYGCSEDDVVYTLIDPQGNTHESPYTFTFDIYEGYDGDWTATAVSPTTTVSDECDPYNVHVEAQTPPTPTTPDPTINVNTDTENEVVVITIEGQGTVTANLTTGTGTTPYVDEDGDGKIVIEIPFVPYAEDAYPEYVNVTATAQNPGENPGYAQQQMIEIPVAAAPVTPPTGQCAKPDGGYVNGADFHGVTVTLTNNETAEGTELHYTVTLDGVVITTDAIYDGPFALTQDGEYQIDFWATAPGMLDSTHGGLIFTIDEETGLSELLSGKTIANVRYFNMAGQEMQEANGMTIVVTTYTDGTSSAVKVLK